MVALAGSPLPCQRRVTPHNAIDRSMTRADRFTTRVAVVALTMTALLAACSGTSRTSGRPVPPAQRAVARNRLAHTDLQIFMAVDATQSQIDGVRVHLTNDADVAHFAFVTKASAYDEFRTLTGPCEPELLRGVYPAVLPTSFRVETLRGAHVSAVAARYRTTPGVKEVVAPRKPVTTTSGTCPKT